jgi:hypothetical protein
MVPEARLVGLALVLVACGGRRPQEMRALSAAGTETEITRVVELALQADSGSEPADSLYAPHAVVIAEGRIRRSPPRFAGVGSDGQIAITNTQLEIRGTSAWGDVEYRWVSNRTNQARVGRASFVFTPAQGRPGWWIVHAHSSAAR